MSDERYPHPSPCGKVYPFQMCYCPLDTREGSMERHPAGKGRKPVSLVKSAESKQDLLIAAGYPDEARELPEIRQALTQPPASPLANIGTRVELTGRRNGDRIYDILPAGVPPLVFVPPRWR